MAKTYQEMFNQAVKTEIHRQATIGSTAKALPAASKSAVTRMATDVIRQQNQQRKEAAADQARIDKEVFRNKVSNIKLERAEKLKAQKDLAREEARQESTKRRAVQGLVASTRQMVVGAVATSAASVALLSRTAQHFSPASAIRYERAMGSLAATVGMVLAPSFQKLTEFIEDMANWIANLSPSTRQWINTVVSIVTPLAVIASTIGGMALGAMTIGMAFMRATRFVMAYTSATRSAATATAAVAVAANTMSPGAGGVGAWNHHRSPASGRAPGAGPAVAPVGGGNLLPALGSILGAQALVSSIDPQPEKKPWHSKAPGMLGWTSDAVRGGWSKLTTGRSLKSEWESNPANREEKRRLESANYPVQTMNSVLDAGRSFRQQSAQQSSLMSFEDYRQAGQIKPSEKDAKASVEAGLNASIIALTSILGRAIGEMQTAR